MERILPIDLERASLRRSLRGYERGAVDEWMARAAREIETLIKELNASRDRCERQMAEIEVWRAQEETLKSAIIVAQRAAEDTRANAQREADLLLVEARAQVAKAREEVEALRMEAARLAGSLRALADTVERSSARPLAVVEQQAVAE